MPQKDPNCLKKNGATTEHYEVEPLSSVEMVKEFGIASVRQLINPSMVVDMYCQSEDRIAEISMGLFYKREFLWNTS